MPEITGTITRAASRTVERRDGSGSFPIYEIWIDGEGPFVTRKDVFGQAERMLGSMPVIAIVRTEQKGDWTNRYVDFVAPVDAEAATNEAIRQARAAQAGAENSGASQQASQQQTAQQVMQQPSEAEREKNLSIQRQKATDIAATLANLSGNVSPLVYWENVQALARYYQTGEVPSTPLRQNADAYRPYQESDPGPDPSKPPADQTDQIPF